MSLISPATFRTALTGAGVTVKEHDGWTRVDRPGPWDPRGIVVHHTGPPATVGKMVPILINGRPDLPGPLCHIGLAPTGVAHLVGWHDANHAGLMARNVLDSVLADEPPPPPGPDEIDGNASFYGIECIHPGDDTPWPAAQRDALVKCLAAICRAHGWTANSVVGHKEITRRKIDPHGLSMTKLRASVAEALLPTTHVVAPGDTVELVAAAHGISVGRLWRLNRPRLVIGETLRVR